MRFTLHQESRIGRRAINQDRVAWCHSRDALVMVLADGMGGHAHGEIAADIATAHVIRAFQLDARPALADPTLFLSRALTGAHHAIIDHAWKQRLPDPPSTTAVACVVQAGEVQWAHAGDSRAYLLRTGTLLQRSRDHSCVQKLVEQGAISDAAAARHPGRNRIYSCLGGHQSPQIEYSPPMTLENGDLVLLCSDGLWDPLGDEFITSRLDTPERLTLTLHQLLDEAEQRAGNTADNLSAIAMRWNDSADVNAAETIITRTMQPDAFRTELGSDEH